MTWVSDRLRPAAVDHKEVTHLLEELDSTSFEARQQAFQKLEALGDLAVPQLRQALAGKPSAEVLRNAEQLLEKARGPLAAGPGLRAVRIIQALEWMATPEAISLLRRLGEGTSGVRITEEAKASLARLNAGREQR